MERRLFAALSGWALLLLAPLLVLFWLLLNPEINASFAIPIQHFYIVTIVHLLSLGVSILVIKAAVEMREFRVLFLGLGFMTLSGFFAVHALSTPGILIPAPVAPDGGYALAVHALSTPGILIPRQTLYQGSVAGLSAFLSLLLAALFFAASATRLPLLIRRRTSGMALALVILMALVILAYGISGFLAHVWFEQIPITFPWGSYLTAAITIGLLIFAIQRNFLSYSLSRLPMQWALVTGFVLLAEAQLSMAISPTWTLAWWEYHFLMLLGAGAAMAGLLVQYSRNGSLRAIMNGVFELENLVQIELENAETIAALAAATEAKDPFTKGHTVRVAEKAVALGKALQLPNDKLRVLARAGLLHDIGKLGIPDSILLKPGPLTAEEFRAMKEHPHLGLEILQRVGSLEREIKVVKAHHERMDGAGYPDGVAGEELPIEARVVAVADVWDSLSSNRPYRKALPVEQVQEILKQSAGSHLDPQVVEACLKQITGGSSKETK